MMREDEINALEKGVGEALQKASSGFDEELEAQQRAWAKPFRLVGRINHAAKLVFVNLGRGDAESAMGVLEGTRILFNELKDVPLPDIHKSEKVNSGGEAFTKAALEIAFYPALIGEKSPAEIQAPSKEDLGVSLAAWVNGLAKFASEAGKLATSIVYYQVRYDKLPIADVEIHERSVAIAEGIQRYLDRFSTVHPALLNVTHNRENDFNSRKSGVATAIVRAMEDANALTRGEIPEVPQE